MLLLHPAIARRECVAVCFFSLQLTVVVCQLHDGAGMQTDLPPPLSLKTDCRQNISSDAEWLDANLGPFSTVASYSDLKDLNISGVKCLPSVMFLLSHSFKRAFDWHRYLCLCLVLDRQQSADGHVLFPWSSVHLSWQLWKTCHLIRKQSCCWIRPPVLLKM